MYSALTVVLHPLTVAKIRRQILMHGPSTSSSSTTSPTTASTSSIHPSAATTTMTTATPASTSPTTVTNYIRQYYRGLGVVVSLAIPARIIYISTLEFTREWVDTSARQLLLHPPPFLFALLSSCSSSSSNNCNSIEISKYLSLVTPLSGGIAGGLAAVSSQLIVVPMDVISQKLIVMDDSVYNTERGRAMNVARTIVQTDGWKGLYKGFGLSLFTSLPAGSIWWGTYAGIRNHLSAKSRRGGRESENEVDATIPTMARQGIIQIVSAFGAATAAAVVTQPLDTFKTRLQIGTSNGDRVGVLGGMSLSSATTRRKKPSFVPMAKELISTTGVSGLYKGLLPRIVHMGVWGSVLSAAYEVLKLVSRKDFEV